MSGVGGAVLRACGEGKGDRSGRRYYADVGVGRKRDGINLNSDTIRALGTPIENKISVMLA